jgi:hypothetical protein
MASAIAWQNPFQNVGQSVPVHRTVHFAGFLLLAIHRKLFYPKQFALLAQLAEQLTLNQ